MADYNWYVSEAEKNYAPTREAIQNQINAIPGQQQTAINDINKQYANQQATLDRNRDVYNRGAETNASSRGLGWSNIASNYQANYNRDSYAPAVTQLQTNQGQDISRANESYTNRRQSLETTLASLIDEQRKYAMQQYQTALDREAQERAAARAAAAQQAAISSYLGGQQKAATAAQQANSRANTTFMDWLNNGAEGWVGGPGYSGVYDPNNQKDRTEAILYALNNAGNDGKVRLQNGNTVNNFLYDYYKKWAGL
jgi:hypothetical protein